MMTITSPDGRTHLVQTHPTVYRDAWTHTVTWCGIRTTRGWMANRGTPSTCGVCQRRHDATAGADATSSDDERGPAGDAVSEGPAEDDMDTHRRGGDTEGDEDIWSRPNPRRQRPENDVWSRPSPRPAVTGNTFVIDDS